MDFYLYEQFVTLINNNDKEDFLKYLLLHYQEEIDTKNKKYLLYKPHEKGIELIIETTKVKKEQLDLNQMLFHHYSNKEWEFKIVTELTHFPNTYVVKRPNNTGSSIIRIINEGVIENGLKENDNIKGQVCGIVMLANLYESESEYRENVPTNEDGNKTVMNDGYLIPFNLLNNSNSKLTEEERNSRDHRRDNLLTFKAKLKNVQTKQIEMFNIEVPDYYTATIDTNFGELDIIIPRSIANKYKKEIKEDTVIIGELLLSFKISKGKITKKKKK